MLYPQNGDHIMAVDFVNVNLVILSPYIIACYAVILHVRSGL